MTNHTDTSRSGDLKPCPFCGDKPIIEDGANDRPWVVQCINRDCPAQPFMDHADTKRQAIAAWNTRPADRIEALEAENARLREALGDLIEAVQRRTADLGGYDGRFGLNKSITKARAALGEKQ